MSKHRRNGRKQPQGIAVPTKWLPIIAILIGLIVIGGVVFAISRPPAAEPQVTGAPAIEVEQSYFDLGDMRFNQTARVTYRIKNVGDQPLEIVERPNVQVLEGC